MSDLEMTEACAEAMGYKPTVFIVTKPDLALGPHGMWVDGLGHGCRVYDPLEDDAQAMALVKKFKLHISVPLVNYDGSQWWVGQPHEDEGVVGIDLNRAIVKCVSKMQAAK